MYCRLEKNRINLSRCFLNSQYSSDDGPKMCFNAAKSWQLGWYSSKHETVMDLAIPGTSWSGRLAGISDYATTNDPVLVKLETGSSTDYYINFNRYRRLESTVELKKAEIKFSLPVKEGMATHTVHLLYLRNCRREEYTALQTLLVPENP